MQNSYFKNGKMLNRCFSIVFQKLSRLVVKNDGKTSIYFITFAPELLTI